jgi:mercuric reductase
MSICSSTSRNGRFDLAVIGAGSAGFSAAIAAAEQGARVALIGYGTIGGTCVNVGCVPSKTLIRAAESLHHARAATRFGGLAAAAHVADWPAVIGHKDQLVGALRQAKYLDLLPAYNSIVYLEVDRPARLAASGVVADGELIKAGKVIIATGGSPAVPPIPGIDQVPYLTSATALALEELPRSLLVIGGGYIGCELGQLFARAGVQVTIVDILPILATAEPEIARALTQCFGDEGMAVRDRVTPRRIRRTGDGVALEFATVAGVETLQAAQILLTTGRRPNTDGLGLDEAGVELASNGGLEVDWHMRTTRPGTYAAGDVTGKHQFVYMAAYGAKVAAENALNGDRRRYDAAALPWVVFIDPQVASVGLSEAQAREQGFAVKAAILPLDQVPARSPHAIPAA